MHYIGIYCSASTHIRPVFQESAIQLATWMGKNKLTLVNGGSNQGLMEIFSKTIHENGGKSIGVVPSAFETRGWFSRHNDEIIFVENLSDRKELIKEKSDVLIVFPGGIGTMDEFFDAWSSFNLGFHGKKIILVNVDNFYKPLLDFLAILKEERFTHDFLPNPLIIADSVNHCIEILESLK